MVILDFLINRCRFKSYIQGITNTKKVPIGSVVIKPLPLNGSQDYFHSTQVIMTLTRYCSGSFGLYLDVSVILFGNNLTTKAQMLMFGLTVLCALFEAVIDLLKHGLAASFKKRQHDALEGIFVGCLYGPLHRFRCCSTNGVRCVL